MDRDLGIIDEITLATALATTDLDLTKDPQDNTIELGPCREVWVISGSGSLVYVDGARGIGKSRTLTGLAVGDGGRCSAKTIKKAGTDTSLVLRVVW